jgi:hypothetical protein
MDEHELRRIIADDLGDGAQIDQVHRYGPLVIVFYRAQGQQFRVVIFDSEMSPICDVVDGDEESVLGAF